MGVVDQITVLDLGNRFLYWHLQRVFLLSEEVYDCHFSRSFGQLAYKVSPVIPPRCGVISGPIRLRALWWHMDVTTPRTIDFLKTSNRIYMHFWLPSVFIKPMRDVAA